MPSITFDTHENVKKLKAVGFTDEQAEVQTRIIADLVNDQLATKQDLEKLKNELTYELTIRLGSMLLVGIIVVATLVKIL
mgnify:CR=1 FL=1